METCDPIDVGNWTADRPALGQCGATALVVRDILGGELLEAEVLYTNGARQGFHYWNRLPERDLDFTREQFTPDEILQSPRVVEGPPVVSWIVEPQYRILRERVRRLLEDSEPSSV